MGATDAFRSFEFEDPKRAASEFNAACRRARPEDHEGYSGTIAEFEGCQLDTWTSPFENSDAAAEHILDKHEKYDDAIGVRFYLPVKLTDAKKKRIEKLFRKVETIRSKLREARTKARVAVVNAKSATIGCKKCGSKVARKYVGMTTNDGAKITLPCPVCAADLFSLTVATRVAAMLAKVHAAEKELRDAKTPKSSQKVGWLIGGWAAE